MAKPIIPLVIDSNTPQTVIIDCNKTTLEQVSRVFRKTPHADPNHGNQYINVDIGKLRLLFDFDNVKQ